MHHRALESPYTKKDIRYTTKNGNMYAFLLDWPGAKNPVTLVHLAPGNARIGEIVEIRLLGHSGLLEFEHHLDGLKVQLPDQKPCEHAHCLEIRFRE